MMRLFQRLIPKLDTCRNLRSTDSDDPVQFSVLIKAGRILGIVIPAFLLHRVIQRAGDRRAGSHTHGRKGIGSSPGSYDASAQRETVPGCCPAEIPSDRSCIVSEQIRPLPQITAQTPRGKVKACHPVDVQPDRPVRCPAGQCIRNLRICFA